MTHEGDIARERELTDDLIQELDGPNLRARLGQPPAPEVCGRCRTPFDPDDTRWNGKSRYGTSPFCKSCIDRCHESTDAFHRCPVCTFDPDQP